uniref:Secreted protein n=1 Tax=Sarcocystis aucheniae TaxID=65407 RepID=A0A5P9S4L9_9APIC|nr:hypothetical protein [Sarcocystis aucheniae]
MALRSSTLLLLLLPSTQRYTARMPCSSKHSMRSMKAASTAFCRSICAMGIPTLYKIVKAIRICCSQSSSLSFSSFPFFSFSSGSIALLSCGRVLLLLLLL